MIDLSPFLQLLAAIDPRAAALGAVALVLVQRLAGSPRGKALLAAIRAKLGLPPVATPTPAAPAAPTLSATDEAHETLLDILAEQLRKRLKSKGDPEKAVAEFSRIVTVIDPPKGA